MKNICVLLGSLLLPGVLASASPIQWNFTNIVLPDGTTVNGSFVFDANVNPLTSAFTSLSMTTTGGSSVPATSNWFFDTANISGEQNAGGVAGFEAVDANGGNLTGAHFVSLFSTSGPLFTNAGGTLTMDFKRAGTCADSTCANVNSSLSNTFSFSPGGAFVSAAAVPEPTTVILSGSGLLLAIGLRRYAQRRASSARS